MVQILTHTSKLWGFKHSNRWICNCLTNNNSGCLRYSHWWLDCMKEIQIDSVEKYGFE